MRAIEYECRRCGKAVTMEPLRCARTVLRDSVRVDGSMHELCPACIRSLHVWFAGGEVELLGGGSAGCRLAAENLLELLEALPDSLARTLAVRAAEECALWIGEIEEGEE